MTQAFQLRLLTKEQKGLFNDVGVAMPFTSKMVRQQLTQFPVLAVSASNEGLGIGSIGGPHRLGIPMEFLGGAEGDVAELVGLGQQAGVLEVAQGRCAAFAGIDPVLVMAVCRAWNKRIRFFEAGKLLFGKQHMSTVVGQQHALVADEQMSVGPLRDSVLLPDFAVSPGPDTKSTLLVADCRVRRIHRWPVWKREPYRDSVSVPWPRRSVALRVAEPRRGDLSNGCLDALRSAASLRPVANSEGSLYRFQETNQSGRDCCDLGES